MTEIKTNTSNSYDTLSLLNSLPDFVHINLHTMFKQLRPVKRKYRLPVNQVIILNGCYLLHCYSGSLFSSNQIYAFVSYYNRPKINFYLGKLIERKYLEKSDIIRGIQYYRITLAGIEVINFFHSTYQAQLTKFIEDHNIKV